MATGLQTLITSQPGKFLFTLLVIGVNIIRFPFWILYNIPPSLRPNKSWSFAQAIRMRVLKAALQNMWHVEMKTPESLKPHGEGKQWVVVQPASASSYTGVILRDP